MIFPQALRQVQIVWEGECVRRLSFVDAPSQEVSSPATSKLTALLQRYFDGEMVSFTNVPLVLEGTSFQHKVWKAIQAIPYGEVRTYRAIAANIGQPLAARAVGNAAAANPIVLLVPCHRVIRSDGTAGNYGGGHTRKQHLLALESPPRRRVHT